MVAHLYKEDGSVIPPTEITSAICAALLKWLDGDFSETQVRRHRLPPVTLYGNDLTVQRVSHVLSKTRKLPVDERKQFLENDCTEMQSQVATCICFVHCIA